MKKLALSVFVFAIVTCALAQNSSKIPFQGNLTESGSPISGERSFVFSIDAVSWTESHSAVTITNGFYAVVLGSINPLPETLFDGVDSRALNISIEGESLGALTIYAPFTTAAISADSVGTLTTVTTGTINGFTSTIGGDGADNNRGIYGFANTNRVNIGVQGTSSSEAANAERNTGVYGLASGEGTGNHRGVLGYAVGAGKYNKGLRGIAEGAGNGDTGQGFGEGSINFGVEGNAGGNAWNNTGLEGSNFGEAGVWNFGVHGISNAGSVETAENHGVAGRAFGPGVNYGVYGQAADGVENWAGYFDGNVRVNGDITVDGSAMLTLPDSVGKTTDTATGSINGFTSTIDGDGAEVNRGLYGVASTNGYNVGVQGTSNSEAANSERNTGLYGLATGDGTGNHRGVLGYAVGAGKYNKGIRGIAEGAGNGDTGKGFGEGSINFGLEGNAGGNAWNNTGLEGSNFGDAGLWNFGVHGISSAGTAETAENHGVAGRAFGPGINYGVYGEAGDGVENWAGYFSGDVQANGTLNVDGDIVATGNISGTIATPSDKRLKTDIVTIKEAIGTVRELNGVSFTWNENAPENRQGRSDIGVIAQEVAAVLPELVMETSDGYMAVNYAQLSAVLIEAVKEMDEKIQVLENENASLKQLEKQMAALQRQIDAIQAGERNSVSGSHSR